MNMFTASFLLFFYLILSGNANAHSTEQSQSGHPNESKIAVDVVIKSDTSWDGTPLPAYPTGQPEITILNITVPAGATLPIHEHPYINAGILIKGQLTVFREDNGKTLHLKAGDSITELVKI
ncbi:cupin domain-containing protein [Shewanella surugensis]|uniref:Cupin domain-containing protein n=1 Tax=Shewanella surugensis TaxID=212020 RepID=A0ABT0LJR6_9GAMM|nr:cupin domain-containing protein [Shewanella surugensis]MCL1127910.1 cupin domain-containing protein [Shewanella surugensis]